MAMCAALLSGRDAAAARGRYKTTVSGSRGGMLRELPTTSFLCLSKKEARILQVSEEVKSVTAL